MSLKKFSKVLSGLILIALPFIIFSQRQELFDWWRLRGYTPPAAISQLAKDTAMDEETTELFYVYHPELQDKATFNSHCRENEQTIVLGCYVNHEAIYLFDVTDERLAGVEQVTAAHETLHAAYARLNSKERARVDSMTEAAFSAITDQRLRDTIELYRKQNPTVVPNELHSILGTEVRSLPVDLEEYYSRYFVDRTKVVAYSEQYEKAFTERKNQVVSYDAQLSSMKQQINNLQDKLTNQQLGLAAERSRMTLLKNSGQIEAHNAAVPGYNAMVGAYNSGVDQLTSLVSQYNDIVGKRNAIASEEADLVKAIDSREEIPQAQ